MTTVPRAGLTGHVITVWQIERVEAGVVREAHRLVATPTCRRLISAGRTSIDDGGDGGNDSDKEARSPEQHLWAVCESVRRAAFASYCPSATAPWRRLVPRPREQCDRETVPAAPLDNAAWLQGIACRWFISVCGLLGDCVHGQLHTG